MRALRKLPIGVAIGAVLLCGTYAIAMHYAIIDQFNYRLAVTFDENGHELTRSSVIHVTVRKNVFKLLPEEYGAFFSVRGEGVPVRFPNGVLIFVLMGVAEPRPNVGFTYEAFPAYWHNRKISSLPHQAYPVSDDLRPTMIHFGDLKEPATVELVKPADLSTVVGEAVSLKSITVELTDAPVTWGIQKLIPWVRSTSRAQSDSLTSIGRHGVSVDFPYYLYRTDW